MYTQLNRFLQDGPSEIIIFPCPGDAILGLKSAMEPQEGLNKITTLLGPSLKNQYCEEKYPEENPQI